MDRVLSILSHTTHEITPGELERTRDRSFLQSQSGLISIRLVV